MCFDIRLKGIEQTDEFDVLVLPDQNFTVHCMYS